MMVKKARNTHNVTQKDSNTHSVLIIDSEPDIALILKLYLEEAGHNVRRLSKASQFSALSNVESFSLILLELDLPLTEGFKILQHMHDNYPYIPVVIMTGQGSEEVAVTAMKNGALDYISKPFSLENVAIKIDKAISESAERRHIFNQHRVRDKMLEDSVNLIEKLKAETAKFKEKELNSIVKSIEFGEDTYQAGVSILSYFSNVVKQKYPTTKVKIRIEQDGHTVRLVVETPDGKRDEIEQTLENYGLVLAGHMQPEELLQNPVEVMQLKHKLDMALMEVKHTRDLLAHTKDSHTREIAGLRDEVDILKVQISEAFKRETHARETLTKIIEQFSVQGAVKEAIDKLSGYLDKPVVEDDKEVVLELISVIQEQNKPAFDAIKAYMIASLGGASGNLISTWLPKIFSAF